MLLRHIDYVRTKQGRSDPALFNRPWYQYGPLRDVFLISDLVTLRERARDRMDELPEDE